MMFLMKAGAAFFCFHIRVGARLAMRILAPVIRVRLQGYFRLRRIRLRFKRRDMFDADLTLNTDDGIRTAHVNSDDLALSSTYDAIDVRFNSSRATWGTVDFVDAIPTGVVPATEGVGPVVYGLSAEIGVQRPFRLSTSDLAK